MSGLELGILLFGLSLIVLGITVSAIIQWQLSHERPELPPYLVERSGAKR